MPYRSIVRRLVRILAPILLTVAILVGGWQLYLSTPEPVLDVSAGARGPTIGAVYFGGPDQPVGRLRQVLLDRIRATPPGEAITWATYYFLDPELARALIAASDRGVKVILVVEGDPRLETANNQVLAMLRRHSLHGGLVVRRPPGFPFEEVSGKLHIKIYAFSYPRPSALVGSFNPSGGGGGDAATIREIGDQDRGHNLLVEIASRPLIDRLVAHVHLLAENGGSVDRFSIENNRIVRDRDTALYFYPRLRADIVEQAIDRLGPGDHLWAAVSHLKNETVGNLIDAAERGATLDLIVHDTERRVPQRAIDRLTRAGVLVRRFRTADGLPMHAKFFVLEQAGRRTAYFGSLNFNRNSRLLNDELLVASTDAGLSARLLRRFVVMDREVDRQPVAGSRTGR
ncbi:phospholipase D-like domain-containing protein [Sphingomonas profundi]|uniref:phospholipase D-like domain-containing protein n=1 Tax=Alterirhizorhabdus profundi TaxID=2681549 RepID=UPI0012E72C30|nr:phospholipase D-like domain-containing protein [Sphingomonas profundi]